MKELAKILDATASYRSIWRKKEPDRVLWIDIEPEIELKPDILMDCTNTDFEDGRFHTIFFDPPHSYNFTKNTGIHQTPSRKLQKEKWGNTGSYYGFERYKSKTELLRFIDKAQLEFLRILSDDGILWFKWGELRESVDNVLHIFDKWDIMMKMEVAYRGKVVGARTYWFALMKKSQFNKDYDKND